MRVLVVDDDPAVLDSLERALRIEGYAVDAVGAGFQALERQHDDPADAVVLDLRLPDLDGLEVCRRMRAAGDGTAVLMLTARGRAEDVLQGFASGADDYLPKPFELPILIARLEGLLRRSTWMKEAAQRSSAGEDPSGSGAQGRPDIFSFNGKTIDFGELELRTFGNTIHLTLMEAEFLRHLIRNNGKVVSRKSILEDVWGLHEDTDTRAIDNFVVRLRRYIEEDPSQPKHLQTVRGVGYRFVAEPE